MMADDQASVHFPTFDGQESKWHIWKAKFVAYSCYKNFDGILHGEEVSQGEKDSKGAKVELIDALRKTH